MSENPTQEHDRIAIDSPAPKAAKKAAKKAAAKKVAAKKEAKEPAAKKAPAKKVAKKASARSSEPTQAELPLIQESAPAPKPARKVAAAAAAPAPVEISVPAEAKAPAKKAARKKPAAAVEAVPAPAPEAAPAPREFTPSATVQETPAPSFEPRAPREESPSYDSGSSEEGGAPVYGRVPGGGPVNREGQPQQPQQRPHGEGGIDRAEANRERRKRRRKRRREREREGRQAEGGNEGPQAGMPPQQQGQREQREFREPRDQRERGHNNHNNGQQRPQNGRQPQPQHQNQPQQRHQEAERPAVLTGPKTDVDGMLELAPKGFGFLRVASKGFEQARDDVFVSPEMVRRYNLRLGVWIRGVAQEGSRGLQLVEILDVNGLPPDEARKLPMFEELKAVNPSKRISFETTPERATTRVLDIVAPVGRGQRGLIVSPPRSGKTTLLLHIAESVRELHDESLHLIVLLVDERPEEVTEFRRSLPGVEIYASSNDEHPRNHCRIAELCIERAKRLVEGGKHVFLLMDSITRLARAYNGGMRNEGRGIGTGGINVGALETPRRLFAAARNTREAGSLTILATALIQTNSRADEAIFQEFKGTGNMELVLDRKIAENYIYPAVDIFKSGTRREELLLPEHMLHKIHLIRRGLSGHRPVEAMERLQYFIKKFPNNPQMLLEIKG